MFVIVWMLGLLVMLVLLVNYELAGVLEITIGTTQAWMRTEPAGTRCGMGSHYGAYCLAQSERND